MSRGPIVYTGVLASIASVAVAWALSVGSNRVFLPVVLFGPEPLGLLFLALPVAATVGVALRFDRGRRTLWLAGVLTALLTTVLATVVWIGWVVVDCGVNLERCVV